MMNTLKKSIKQIDHAWINTHSRLFKERNSLIVFFFHMIIKESDRESITDPSLGITIIQFKQCIDYFLAHEYTFIGPGEINEKLSPAKKYAMITFDDGYFNNTNALPVLDEYGVPALFFMTVNNIIHQKRFWWDVIYDYYSASGKKLPKMTDEIKELKTKPSHELERHIISQYGPDAFQIKNDLTRPFYADEVRDFSRHKHVVIGNHTMDHAILTNLSQQEVMDQIMNAQDELQNMIGYTPRSLAYPNGNYSAQVLETMKESGIPLGFTTTGKKNSLPLPDQHQISRVDITMETDIRQQCDRIRSDISLLNQIKWYLHP